MALTYPQIDPVIFSIGPIIVRWYALAYIAGLVLGWRYAVHLARRHNSPYHKQELDDFLLWATVGIILGGRFGYVFFYNLEAYLAKPLQVFAIWNGGMSFHGGLLGMILAMLAFATKREKPFLSLTDIIATVAPIGLFFGRIANFINAELYGKPTDAWYGMVFPTGGNVARHPSQLYQAALEGVALFIILWGVQRIWRFNKRPGLATGIFLTGYSIARFLVEYVRQPDDQLGYLTFDLTMGQLLSIPMGLIGLYVVLQSRKLPPIAAHER